jgi:hypothetical protein
MAKKYPECEKLEKFGHKIDIVREFLDVAQGYGIRLCEDQFACISECETEHLLAKFIGVDWVELDKERREMLAEAAKSGK